MSYAIDVMLILPFFSSSFKKKFIHFSLTKKCHTYHTYI